MKRFVIMFIISTLIASMLVQCEKDERFHWTTYTTSDGLVSNYVTAIAIDKEGNKWFGTEEGVSKFDGTNWTSYTEADGLVSNYVTAIAIDKEGNKWFGTQEGVSKFDGTNWTSYTKTDGLVDNGVNAIAIDNAGNKWIGAHDIFGSGNLSGPGPTGGVSKFDGTTWTNYYSSSNGLFANGVNEIIIDVQGNIWFGTWGYFYVEDLMDVQLFSGVSKFDGTTWTNYYSSSNGLITAGITEIATDALGNIWFGTGEGVSKFDGTNWTNYTTTDGLVDGIIQAIAIDPQGNIWFGADNEYSDSDGGVSKFDGINWTTYKTSDGLVANGVIAIAIDTEGNKWFGTMRGVSKLSDKY